MDAEVVTGTGIGIDKGLEGEGLAKSKRSTRERGFGVLFLVLATVWLCS